MGFFKRKKADRDLLKNDSFEWMTVGEAMTKERMKSGKLTYSEMVERCEECCEQYAEALGRRNEIQRELENADEYFNDIVRLDELTEKERYSVEDMTKNLVKLIDERTRYEESERSKITATEYLMMERHESEVPASLEVLKEQEQLRAKVVNDMHTLEREKERLEDDLEQLKGKRVFYRQASVAMIITIIIVLGILLYLSMATKADLTLVFLITLFIGALFAAGILLAHRSNSYNTKLTGAKINKAIKLTNSTKIKFVNSTNAIDFTCDKYNVDGYRELNYLWETYLEAKAEREKYKKNGGKVDELSEALIRALTGMGFKNPDLIVCQPECIINRNERVELRHRLSERRRAIRDRLDFARVRCDSTKGELLWMTSSFPEHAAAFENIMKSYGLYEFAPSEEEETT